MTSTVSSHLVLQPLQEEYNRISEGGSVTLAMLGSPRGLSPIK